ncbi:hypothetical protein BK704_34230 [[Bacillus thuringiensis] serovar konkukian]|nr:flagellin lysine-N-methylase [Bacillus thuringiensis]ANN35659.1 hypothetical protein A9498_29545 [Bacillus thuringiensis serovar coreanensis]MED1299448.1 flagellin lysine-N-methylase [Bacillus pacificus]OUA92159.1 hypothetical protein BK704_34230 [[Bacillus thuringiensis] serovar konkukian]
MKPNVWIANYLYEFSCIGSQCEDTCCKGEWNVTIDKKQYERYKQIDAERQHLFFQSSININTHDVSEENYATITWDVNSGCSFLTKENLCEIHKNYGPDLLCNTCRYYPRQTKKISEQYYQTGHLSCPEIARLTLLSNKSEQWKLSTDKVKEFPIFKESQANRNYYKKFHNVIVDILRQTQYSLQKRLWLIGEFIIHVSTLAETHGKSKSIVLALKHVKQLKKNGPGNLLDEQNTLFMKDILQMINKMRQDSRLSLRFKECLELCIQGLELRDPVPMNLNFVRNYKKKYDACYKHKPFFVKYPQILTNYCLYAFQRDLFPYDTKKLPFQYIAFLIEFVILTYMLVGISASTLGLTETIVIQLFQSYSKVFHHNASCYNDYIVTIHDQLYVKYKEEFTLCTSILLSE